MFRKIFHSLMSRLDTGAVGITYWDGVRQVYGQGDPNFEIIFKHSRVLRAMAKNMSIGFGEGIMSGDIEVKGELSNLMRLVIQNTKAFHAYTKYIPRLGMSANTPDIQKRLVQHHYDLGNDFYKLWLDKSMTYSCAYFTLPTRTLEQAQADKVDYVLGKLAFRKGQSLLDIGSGWGSLLIRAAQKYHVTGVGITLSQKQLKYSQAKAMELGLSDKIKFRLINLSDFAEQKQKFDRVVSVGMFEHVGRSNHKSYYQAVSRLLNDGGVSLLHTISQQKEIASDSWIDKYIFPGGYIPSVREVASALPDYDLRLIDYENLRLHYAKTLEHWWKRFEQNKDEVIKMYDDRFYRMWRLYLASSMASFQYGSVDLSQFVFTKGINNELPAVRFHLPNQDQVLNEPWF